MLKVYNKAFPHPSTALYIGRGSIAGNPFIIGKDGTRDEVCDLYEKYLERNLTLKTAIISYCKGHDLLCYCAPKRCHGNYLLKISNEENQ